MKEQKNFCAYTDEPLSVTNSGDIEHFNPTLKNTPKDNYTNWFLVGHEWNKRKGYKWDRFQPVIHPTDPGLEERIIYKDGNYFPRSESDKEAENLIRLLQLDHPALAEKRKCYIKRVARHMKAYNETATSFFSDLLEVEPCGIFYPRAIKEEFGIDVWQMINT